MKVDLKKELKKEKDTFLSVSKEQQDSVKTVKLLLAGEDQEDHRILTHLGANSTVMQLENIRNDNLQLEKLDQEYGEVFTVDQIRNLAIDYRLRFLNSRRFIGDMDKEVTAKIKEFAKKTNTSLDEHTLQTRFFILAVPSSFSLEKVKAIRFEEARERRRRAKLDPVLFYKIDEEHYRLIHQWGKEFTLYRRILGWKWKSHHTYRTFNWLTQLPLFALLFSFIAPNFGVVHPFLTAFFVSGLSFILAWVRNLKVLNDGGTLSEDRTTYQTKFFTPTNWNSTELLFG
jgi:hypothetical protein